MTDTLEVCTFVEVRWWMKTELAIVRQTWINCGNCLNLQYGTAGVMVARMRSIFQVELTRTWVEYARLFSHRELI